MTRRTPLTVVIPALAVVIAACSPAGPNFSWPSASAHAAARVIEKQLPPQSLAVIWRRDPDDHARVLAADWSAHAVGWLRFDRPIQALREQSPDGSRLAVDDSLYASDGALIASDYVGGMWADDSRRLCEVLSEDATPRVYPGSAGGHPSAAWLFLSTPGQIRHRVAHVADFSEHGNVTAVACSPGTDRAVITESFTSRILKFSVFSLSSGQLLYSTDPGSDVFSVVATHDARLIAENDASCGGALIRDVTRNGGIVGRVQHAFVSAFSWDGDAALTTAEMANPSYLPRKVTVRAWHDNAVVWSEDIPPNTVDVRPAGTSFLIGVPAVSPGYKPLTEHAFIVDGSGRALEVAEHTEIPAGSGVDESGIGDHPSTGDC